jgi:hypothetical protein
MLQIKRIAFAFTILQGGSCVSANLERRVLCTWCFSMELAANVSPFPRWWHMACVVASRLIDSKIWR